MPFLCCSMDHLPAPNLCFLCHHLNVCMLCSWIGGFLQGRMAGTGWLLDSKPAATLLSTLCPLELTFPPATFGGSGCSSLPRPEQSSQKGFLMQRRQGEGPGGSHASEVCPPGTFPKAPHAAFPRSHASLVPVSFFFPLTCVNMCVHGNMGHTCIYSHVCGGQRHHLPLLRQGLSLTHIG